MLTKFTGDLDIIAALDDEPNDEGGLTAAELKAKFDEGAKAVAAYINETLTEELEGVVLPAEGTGILEKTASGVAWAPRTAPNVLRNWDFLHPVNQRGAATWNAGKYGIDCWKSNGGTSEIGAGGLVMANLAQSMQFIRLGRLVKGEKYTLSVKLAADVAHVESGWSRRTQVLFKGAASAYASSLIATLYPESAGVSSVTFTVPDTDYAYGYCVIIDAGKNYLTEAMTVEAVKLEKGESSTLAYDGPADPAIELLRCQTSFQIFAEAARCPTSRLDFRPVMDADPTIGTLEIGGVTYTTASCEP